MPSRKRLKLLPKAPLAAIVEFSHDAIISNTLDGIITSWNQEAKRLFGYTAKEAIGKPVTLLLPPGKEGEESKILEEIRQGRRVNPYDTQRKTKDGTMIDISLSVSPILDEKRRIIGASNIARDISERKRADAARLHLAAVVDSSDDAIITKSLKGIVTSWNPSAHRMLGYSAPEILGKPITMLIPPDRQGEEPTILEKIKRGERVAHFETIRRRKDGSLVEVSLTISPIKDEHGRVVGVSKIMRDISERKRLEARLGHAHRLEIVGKLAGGIAHDFNNLLTPILGYCDLIKEKLGAQDPIRADLEEIGRAGARAAALTKQLLAFSRRQVLQPRVIELNPLVSEMAKLLQRVLGEDISLTLMLAPNLGRVKVDPGQMEQVIMNLAVNSRDAMPRGGKFTIETINAELDASYSSTHPEVVPGKYAVLITSDTGSGMDKETLSRLFEPFFTTKALGNGTGLGLATVHGIVKQSGGHIWVYSEPGRGTTFKIYFPQVDESPEPVDKKTLVKPSARGSETILIAEDDGALRSLASRILKEKGYVVLEADRGEEALVQSKRYEGSIDLLLTDVVMPGISGRELAKQIKTSRPAVKVLYMSGYTENAIVHHGVLDEGTTLLDKPFTPESLSRAVRKVLDTL